MTQKFKQFYFVVTVDRKWGRGAELKDAMKNAGITKSLSMSSTKSKKPVQFVIYIGVVKPTATDAQVENIAKCFYVDSWAGLQMYRPEERDIEAMKVYKEDEKMVDKFLVGWITENSFINS